MDILEIFPSNGLDRSILAPVLLGLGFLAFFAETLGWPFVGLVVPGYLASIWTTAPVTAATVIGESVCTYWLARAIGQWIPRTGAWSAFFGRERFFLLIISSVFIRLVSEGYALPTLAEYYRFRHASELYSLGLVLVPLMANSFWNVGFMRGVFFSGVSTSLTYLVLNYLLLPHTNLSLSRFELTYESVALDFLQAGKAYLIILAGALLAARSNILYGWDFNGVLVPGLLAIAWYSPLKLVTTLGEAVIVAFLAQQAVRLPPLSRQLVEGPRRIVLAFVIGFSLKICIGYAGMWLWAGERMTDFYGFGYVLPSLVAVKIWERQNAAQVIMPTIRISLLGFLVGNVVGYSLQLAYPLPPTTDTVVPRFAHSESLAAELTLQSSWPLRGGATEPEEGALTLTHQLIRTMNRKDQAARLGIQPLAEQAGLGITRTTDSLGATWWVFRTLPGAEYKLGRVPAVALRETAGARGAVVAFGDSAHGSAALAAFIAAQLDAGLILVVPDGMAEETEQRWIQALSDASGWNMIAELRANRDSAVVKTIRLQSPGRAALAETLGVNASPKGGWHVLRLDAQRMLSAAARGVGETPPIQRWPADLFAELMQRRPQRSPRTSQPGMVAAEALRAFSRLFVPVMTGWSDGFAPPPHVLSLAEPLGYRFALVQDGTEQALILFRPRPRSTQDWLVWAARRTNSGLLVSTPDATGQADLCDSVRMLASLSGASHVVLGDVGRAGGAGESRDSITFRRSYYQRAHELLLDKGVRVLQARRIPVNYQTTREDLVLTTGDVARRPLGIPAWTSVLSPMWAQIGVKTRWYDASSELFAMRGTVDPVLGYARRFAPSGVILVWIAPEIATRWRPKRLPRLLPLFERFGMPTRDADVAQELDDRAGSAGSAACNTERLFETLDRLYRSRNPHLLSEVVKRGRRCNAVLVRDSETRVVYLVAHSASHAAACRLDDCTDRWIRNVNNLPEARRAIVGRRSMVARERRK